MKFIPFKLGIRLISKPNKLLAFSNHQTFGKLINSYFSIKVIGDKFAPETAGQVLAKTNNVFPEIKKKVKVPIKFIHVLRNPFDVVGTYAYRIFSKNNGRNIQGSVRNKNSYTVIIAFVFMQLQS